ncbi:MAG: hypothetical protein ACYC64_12540 [Armatimonadota bacterium]
MKYAIIVLVVMICGVTAPTNAFAELLYGESSLSLLVEDTLGHTVADWNYDFPGLSAEYTTEAYPSARPPFTLKLENIHCELVPNPTVLAPVFSNIPLVANVGNTFWFSGQNDPQIFAALANHLTNPVPGQTSIWASIGFADSRNNYLAAAGHGIYLSQGVNAEVSRIGVRVDYATVTPPSVPEPSSAAALSCLLMSGIALTRRSRNRI